MGANRSFFGGVLFGSVGLGLFLYGKKLTMPVSLVCDSALMVYPYFMPNVVAMVLIGLVLVTIPYFFVFK